MSDELGDSMEMLLHSSGLVESVTFRRVRVDRTPRIRLNTDPDYGKAIVRTEMECELVLLEDELARLMGTRSVKSHTMQGGQDVAKRLLGDALGKLRRKVRSVGYMAEQAGEFLENA